MLFVIKRRNKMNKSRIIIPAIALLAFSVAASVTGTVAWFTTRRTATLKAGTYAVVKTSANLDVVPGAGLGTTVSSPRVGEHVVEVTDAVLTDASFNHLTGKIYQPNEFGDNWHETYPEVAFNDEDLADKLERGELADGTTKIYSAVEFTLTFNVLFGSSSGDYGLFIDNSSATKTNFKAFAPDGDTTDPNDELSGDAIKTAKGFRMGFYPTTASVTKASVIADLQTGTWDHDGDAGVALLDPPQTPTAEVNKIRHVNTNANQAVFANPTDYGSAYLMDSTYAEDMPDAEELTHAEALLRPDYLGKFTFSANSTVSLSYTVVCWFEGTDPNIVNQSNEAFYQKVVANISFEAIKLHA